MIFKKFKEIQKFFSPKRFDFYSKYTIRDEPMKENKALLEKINSFPKEDEEHKEDLEKLKEIQKEHNYDKKPEEYKKIEEEKENLIKKVRREEIFALFATIALAIVAIVGLIFTYEEKKKKYSFSIQESNVEKVHAHFKERKISLDAKNQIQNTEIEDLMKNVVDLARRINSIYLIYGENGIGKSIAMKKTLLRNPDLDFLYIENGIDELVKIFVPDYYSKSEYSSEKVIDNALTDYGDYRRQMKEKQPENFKENAIIVFDNTDKIKDEKLLQLKDIIKITLVDNKRPIVFIFLSNEGKGTSVLMRKMSVMTVFKAKEPSKQFALDYFESCGIPKEYYSELEKITGSNLKYLNELNQIDKNLSKEEFLKSAKRLIHAKISPEIAKWLKVEVYPEIIDVCKEIIQNNSISTDRFDYLTFTKKKKIEGRDINWQDKVLKGNLFQVDDRDLTFQNRAITQYVKEYLKEK
jgi:hypothetical protein